MRRSRWIAWGGGGAGGGGERHTGVCNPLPDWQSLKWPLADAAKSPPVTPSLLPAAEPAFLVALVDSAERVEICVMMMWLDRLCTGFYVCVYV